MCHQCVEACRRLYPMIKDDQIGDFLMAVTPYPMGSPADVAAALAHVRERSDGTVEGAIAFVDEEVETAMATRESASIDGVE